MYIYMYLFVYIGYVHVCIYIFMYMCVCIPMHARMRVKVLLQASSYSALIAQVHSSAGRFWMARAGKPNAPTEVLAQ